MTKKIFIQLLLTLLILIIFIAVYQKYFKKISDVGSPSTNEKDLIQENNLLNNITYESTDSKGRKYIIKSETGTIDEQEPDLIYMSNVSAKIILLDKSIVYIDSLKAEYNNVSYDTKFQENIRLKFLNHNVFCNSLNIFLKDNLLEAYNDLTYKNLNIIMLADKIEIDLLTKKSKIFKFDESKVKIEKKSNGNN